MQTSIRALAAPLIAVLLVSGCGGSGSKGSGNGNIEVDPTRNLSAKIFVFDDSGSGVMAPMETETVSEAGIDVELHHLDVTPGVPYVLVFAIHDEHAEDLLIHDHTIVRGDWKTPEGVDISHGFTFEIGPGWRGTTAVYEKVYAKVFTRDDFVEDGRTVPVVFRLEVPADDPANDPLRVYLKVYLGPGAEG